MNPLPAEGTPKVLEPANEQRLDRAMRALTTASRSLRLYPPTSPIPKQTIAAAISALDEFFTSGIPVLSLSVAREGFAFAGQPIATAVGGTSELADELRSHGIAEIDVMPGVTAEELLAFLAVSARPADEVRAEGGIAALAAAAGVESVRVTDVQLTVIDPNVTAGSEEYGDSLRQLVSDPQKLATWFSSASAGDPAAFEESLIELMRIAGPGGVDTLLHSMTSAFMAQPSDGKDALLGLSMDAGPVRDMTARVFGLIGVDDIAESVVGGRFGKNMLSLSSALAHLPLEDVTAQVRAEVQAMLAGAGHSEKESAFLEHMLEIRDATSPEPSLVDVDRTYNAVAQAAALKDEDVLRARGAINASADALNAAGVRTMLSLLDQQRDFELYCAGADNLAGIVPKLIEQGDLALAARVLTELANRQSLDTGPWPELAGRLRDALAKAAGTRSMGSLVAAVIEDRSLAPEAREILRHAGETGGPALVENAIALKNDGLDVAEELLGRRLIDLLNSAAPAVAWYQLAPVAMRLVREGDPRSLATVEALLGRPDEQSRREVATGLAKMGGPAASRLLAVALRDASAEVAVVAAHAIAKSDVPGSAALLASRLGEIDTDNADFLLARELIGALSRTPEPAADLALAKLAGRRSLMKRGHFSEIQQLVKHAQAIRGRGGVR